jgi:hypothetical protein
MTARYPWQEFRSHKIRRVKFQNGAAWHVLDPVQVGAMVKTVAACRCVDCVELLEQFTGQQTLPGVDL